MTTAIYCELRGMTADDVLAVHWTHGKPVMRARFNELWPGRDVVETVTEETRDLGEGRSEIVTVIEWRPADG